jgi:hypothetical protein
MIHSKHSTERVSPAALVIAARTGAQPIRAAHAALFGMSPDRRPTDGKWARPRIVRPTYGAMASSIGAVVVPVAFAMALCVWLVTLLRGDDVEDAMATSGGVISAMYTEKVRRYATRARRKDDRTTRWMGTSDAARAGRGC